MRYAHAPPSAARICDKHAFFLGYGADGGHPVLDSISIGELAGAHKGGLVG